MAKFAISFQLVEELNTMLSHQSSNSFSNMGPVGKHMRFRLCILSEHHLLHPFFLEKFSPGSEVAHFLIMESNERLARVYIPHIRHILDALLSDFHQGRSKLLP